MFRHRPWPSIALAWALFGLPSVALAQGEFNDDEFGDEFEEEFEEPGGAAQSTDSTPPPVGEGEATTSGVEGGDEFDDPFGEEEFTGDSAGAAAPQGPSSESEETESDVAVAPRAEPDDDARTARRLRLHNSYSGPVGGLRVVDARPGVAGTVRAQLLFEFFTAGDFLLPDDSHDHFGGSLSLGWTLLDWLEIFGSLVAYSNSNDQGDPRLIQVIGDLRLGAKVGFDVLPWLTVGGDLTLYQPTSFRPGPDASSAFGAQVASQRDR